MECVLRCGAYVRWHDRASTGDRCSIQNHKLLMRCSLAMQTPSLSMSHFSLYDTARLARPTAAALRLQSLLSRPARSFGLHICITTPGPGDLVPTPCRVHARTPARLAPATPNDHVAMSKRSMCRRQSTSVIAQYEHRSPKYVHGSGSPCQVLVIIPQKPRAAARF